MDEEVGTQQWILAGVFIGGALLVAFVLDRILSRRGRAIADAVERGDISRETNTRLRFVRRLIYAAIVLIGVALALSQFSGVKNIAASLLASSAIAAAVLGFAARQTLANFIAGIMLAVTQPLRVGDWVFVDDHYGVVEDVRLNYTFLRTPAGQQIVVPNEKLASGILRNDSLGGDEVSVEVWLWLPPGADAGRAVAVLEEETGHPVSRGRVDRRGHPPDGHRETAARRPSARLARPACASRASAACTPRGCSGCRTLCSR